METHLYHTLKACGYFWNYIKSYENKTYTTKGYWSN